MTPVNASFKASVKVELLDRQPAVGPKDPSKNSLSICRIVVLRVGLQCFELGLLCSQYVTAALTQHASAYTAVDMAMSAVMVMLTVNWCHPAGDLSFCVH